MLRSRPACASLANSGRLGLPERTALITMRRKIRHPVGIGFTAFARFPTICDLRAGKLAYPPATRHESRIIMVLATIRGSYRGVGRLTGVVPGYDLLFSDISP